MNVVRQCMEAANVDNSSVLASCVPSIELSNWNTDINIISNKNFGSLHSIGLVT